MALSQVAICNLALGHIGDRGRIEALTENGVQSRECLRWYDLSLQEALEAFDWSFARRRIALAVHSDDPPAEWAFRYALPADCLKARRLVNPAGPKANAVPYELELSDDGTQRTLLTNLEDAVLVYTRVQNDPLLYSTQFVLALSHTLASHIALALTGKTAIAEQQMKLAYARTFEAAGSNANEEVPDEPRPAEAIAARA